MIKIPALIRNNPVLVGGALVVVVLAVWIGTRGAKNTGRDIGGGAVDFVFGTAEGVLGSVNGAIGIPTTQEVIAAANNPDINPLHGFGEWLGGSVYKVLN